MRHLRITSFLFLVASGLLLVVLGSAAPGSVQAGTTQAPDLVLDSFTLSPQEPVENQLVTIDLIVANNGTLASGTFWVDFYGEPASPPGVGDFGDDFCQLDVIEPSSSDICQVTYIYGTAGFHSFYVQVDTLEEQSELNEANNISGPHAIEVLPDSDFDAVADQYDNCPDEANAGQENIVHPGTPEGDGCEDPDADELFDSVDNCPDVANPAQENTIHPAVPAGDLCEDPDADAVPDASDTCPDWPNPSQALPNWTVPANDWDCDRFTNAIERYLGTDPTKQCAADTTTNNEDPDPWPTDLNDNQISNTLDAGRFVFTLNQANPNHPGPSTNPEFNVRHDFNGNGIINTLDIGAYVFVLNKTCTLSGP